MRSPIDIARDALVVAVIGLGAVTAAGPTVAYAEPAPGGGDGDVNITPNFPGLPNFPSSRNPDSDGKGGGGGPGGSQSKIPVVESTVTGQTVVVRRPEIPDVPPPVVIPVTPVYEPAPAPEPVNVPVIVEPPVPVAVPVAVPIAPAPVEQPMIPEPPAAPPLPVPASPQVLLTSSAEPGTQALTVILIFTMVVAWIYSHRIASHWTVGRRNHAPTTT